LGRCLAIGPHLKGWRCKLEAGNRRFCHQHNGWLLRTLAVFAGIIVLGWVSTYSYNLIAPPTESERHTEKELEEIKRLLENRRTEISQPIKEDQTTSELDSYLRSKGFEKEYPLGFALFYSDGRRVLYYGKTSDRGPNFNPANVGLVNFTNDEICINMQIQNIDFNNTCFSGTPGSTIRVVKMNGSELDAESIGQSAVGAAWVIGVKPTN